MLIQYDAGEHGFLIIESLGDCNRFDGSCSRMLQTQSKLSTCHRKNEKKRKYKF